MRTNYVLLKDSVSSPTVKRRKVIGRGQKNKAHRYERRKVRELIQYFGLDEDQLD